MHTFAHVQEDGVGAVDVLVWDRGLVVPVPQGQGDAVAAQDEPRGGRALAQAVQRSRLGDGRRDLKVLILAQGTTGVST